MDAGKSPLPNSIHPNNFPAKLWRLVNHPAYDAICWDSQGQAIVIDQHLFERQILSPCSVNLDNTDAFKTTNFSSFVRQLNLYGFRKVDAKDNHHFSGDSGTYHHFHNPNFKRDHPELVASLRRLTVDNKAKLQAGLSVSCRPPSRYSSERFSGDGDGREKNVKRVSSSLLSPTHQESTHPYQSNKAKAKTAHNATPVPPRYLIRGHSAALSPAVFASDKGIPVHLSHLAGLTSSSGAVPLQQALLAHANPGSPNFATFSPSNAQYSPGCYPVCNCYQLNRVASHLTGSGLQTGPFSPHSYYQIRYPVNMLYGGDNQKPQKMEDQEVKECDNNLDTIFQIADEMMPAPPSSRLVQILTPEKTGPVLASYASKTYNTMQCDNSASIMRANSVSAGPIIVAVSGKATVVKNESQEEESVLLVPEQMPEDAICETTGDDAKDTDVTGLEVSDTLEVTSQADKSICTGSTPNL